LAKSWETMVTANDTDPPVLSRPLKVDEIRDGTGGDIAATDAELTAIAGMLDLVALKRLVLSYRLDRVGGSRLRLTGQLQADVTQTCVVTLDSVETQIEVPVAVEFWPAARVEELERSAEETGGEGLLDWPEAVVDGRIDLGPVIYETLATSLDPYPKRPGASFDRLQNVAGPAEAKSGPFAALAALKPRERG
jgi:uncharacterized metal-binding protein YceD (DUF177 family)